MQRIIKIKPFLSKYNWERTNYQFEKDNWKKFDKNNPASDCFYFFVCQNEKIDSACVAKQNKKCEKQFILLMVANEEGWHYIAVKKVICIIKRYIIEIWCWFLLFELSSLV